MIILVSQSRRLHGKNAQSKGRKGVGGHLEWGRIWNSRNLLRSCYLQKTKPLPIPFHPGGNQGSQIQRNLSFFIANLQDDLSGYTTDLARTRRRYSTNDTTDIFCTNNPPSSIGPGGRSPPMRGRKNIIFSGDRTAKAIMQTRVQCLLSNKPTPLATSSSHATSLGTELKSPTANKKASPVDMNVRALCRTLYRSLYRLLMVPKACSIAAAPKNFAAISRFIKTFL